MPKLGKQQLEDFLVTGALVLKLGTMAESGYPHVNPLWYAYENGAFLVAGRSRAQWVGHIRSNSKVAACIDTPDAPYTRVLVQADADIIDDSWTGDWEHWALRYLGEELGHQYYEDTKHMPRILIRLNPNKITTWAGPGWHPRYQD